MGLVASWMSLNIGCSLMPKRSPANVAVALSPPTATDFDSALQMAQQKLLQGDTNQAITFADRAIGANAQRSEAWRLRGRALAKSGDLDRALADLLQAQRLDPANTVLQFEIAELQQSRGDHRACLTALRESLHCECNERRTEALAMAGQSCLALGQTHEALENLYLVAAQGGEGPDVLRQIAETAPFQPKHQTERMPQPIHVADPSNSSTLIR